MQIAISRRVFPTKAPEKQRREVNRRVNRKHAQSCAHHYGLISGPRSLGKIFTQRQFAKQRRKETKDGSTSWESEFITEKASIFRDAFGMSTELLAFHQMLPYSQPLTFSSRLPYFFHSWHRQFRRPLFRSITIAAVRSFIVSMGSYAFPPLFF